MAQTANQNELQSTDLQDILPAQPSSRLSHRTIILWLVTTSLVLFLLPLYLAANAIQSDIAGMESDLKSLKSSIANGATPPADVRKLLNSLNLTQNQANRLNAIYPTLIAPRADWPLVMSAVDAYDPNQIAITSLSYGDQRISLAGRAANDDAVMSYADALQQSNLFSRVVLQSIQTMPTATNEAPTPARTPTTKPTSTKVPTVTAMPTTARENTVVPTSTPTNVPTNTPTFTPSPTTDLRDTYEPDDVQPKSIALGQFQQHNFFPAGDVDVVTFLAKSGRFYRVYTTDLAPGVDTVLNLKGGSLSLTNDDVVPGTQASEIVFENAGEDVMAVVTITNRGQYGADKSYKIFVIEIVPTPTSVPKTPTRSSWMNAPPVVNAGAIVITAGTIFRHTFLSDDVSRPWPTPKNEKVPGALDRMPVKFVILLDLKVTAP